MPVRPLVLALMLTSIATPAVAATAKRGSFGKLPDGRAVGSVTLSNGHGVSATIITYGASLMALGGATVLFAAKIESLIAWAGA